MPVFSNGFLYKFPSYFRNRFLGNVDMMESKVDSSGGIDKTTNSSSHSPEENVTPPVDNGPPEFVPGKQWIWRDPKKVVL